MNLSSKKPKGSILIWTVLLGISLTTAFFFFSQRLNLSTALQRNVLEEQNAQLFLESYADYLESLTFEQLKMAAGELNYEGITGTLTNSLPQTKGVLDSNQTLVYNVASGKARIEWALCSNGEAGRLLELEPMDSTGTTDCNAAYERWAESKDATPFSLKAGVIPVSYKIIPLGSAILYDKTWKMDLKLAFSPKKTLSVQRNFVPVDMP